MLRRRRRCRTVRRNRRGVSSWLARRSSRFRRAFSMFIFRAALSYRSVCTTLMKPRVLARHGI